MTDRFRYQPDRGQIPVKLTGAKPPAKTLDLSPDEFHPVLTEAMDEAAGKARAEEALAVAIDLWVQLTALEKDEKTLLRKRNDEHRRTNTLLNAGQIMGVKAALAQHLQRHIKRTGDGK